MESQPQNPEFRNNPEIFHSCTNEMKPRHLPKTCDTGRGGPGMMLVFNWIHSEKV